jgi:16S rRNA (guanine966-N2)-methyltransferase
LALEKSPKALATLNENKALFDTAELTLHRADSLAYLGNSPDKPFDIVFVDPPFDLNILTEVCALLEKNQWLSADSLIYCELSARHNSFAPPANWRIEKSKAAGGVNYLLYSRI